MGSPSLRLLIVKGFFVIAVFFGVFGSWAVFSPLEGASIASGMVSIDSKRKTVQHFEGGIIKHIFVGEGSLVTEGQELIQLDSTRAHAQVESLAHQQHNALAREARLIAERDGENEILFNEELLAKQDDPRVLELLTNQKRIFTARRDFFLSQQEILLKRLEQNKEEHSGQQKLYDIEQRRLNIIGKEIQSNRKLVDKGFVSKTLLLRLEREEAQIQSSLSQLKTNVTQLTQNIAESEAQLKEQNFERVKQVVESLRDVRQERYLLEERLAAAKDVLARTRITSPIDGTVLNLQVFSQDGVINPGETLLDVVPHDEKMLIEARVSPSDIDNIHQGMPAHIRLTALNTRTARPLEGELLTISADVLIDQQSQQGYYLARVEIKDDIEEALSGVPLYPGMQAEVMLLTEPRTPLQYLLKPLSESFNRAFRE